MNLKKLLSNFVILSIFITGCSSFDKKEVVSDRAKQQQTMTKVQNDVNEIMSKDYEYVLKNMGTPYSTTYWIDKEKISEAKTIDDLNHTGIIGMIYPKYTTNNELDGSALYIELNNNQVVEVQTYDFYANDIEDDILKNDSVIVVDKYGDNGELELKDIQNIKLESYKGKSLYDLYQTLDDINPNLDIYDMIGKTKSVEVYMLNNKGLDSKKVLTVLANDEIIKDIKIIDSDLVIGETKNYLLN